MKKRNNKILILGMILIAVMLMSGISVVAVEYTPDGKQVDEEGTTVRVGTYNALKQFNFDRTTGIVTYAGQSYYYVVDDDDEIHLIKTSDAGALRYELSTKKHGSIQVSGYVYNDDIETGDMKKYNPSWPSAAELKRNPTSYEWAVAASDNEKAWLMGHYEKLKRGDYTEASTGAFTGITYKDPNTEQTRQFVTREEFLAYIYQRAENPPEGSQFIEWKIELEADRKKGVIQQQIRNEADKAYNANRFDRVIELLKDSTAKEDQARVGLAYYKKGDYADAQTYLSGTIGSSSATAEVYTKLADTYSRQGKHKEAVQKLEDAKRTKPELMGDADFKRKLAQSYVQLADWHSKQVIVPNKENYNAAIVNFEKAAETDPSIRETAAYKAAVKNLYQREASYYEGFAEKTPDSGAKKRSLEAAARAYDKMVDEGGVTGSEAAELKKKSADIYKRIGQSAIALSRYDAAIAAETDADKKKAIETERDTYKTELEEAGKSSVSATPAEDSLADVDAKISVKDEEIKAKQGEIQVLLGQIATADPEFKKGFETDLRNRQRELNELSKKKAELETKKISLQAWEEREKGLIGAAADSRLSKDNALLPADYKITEADLTVLKSKKYNSFEEFEKAYEAMVQKKLDAMEKDPNQGRGKVVEFYTGRHEREKSEAEKAAERTGDKNLAYMTGQADDLWKEYRAAEAKGDAALAKKKLEEYEALQKQISDRTELLKRAETYKIDASKLDNAQLEKEVEKVEGFESFCEQQQTIGLGTWDAEKRAFTMDGKTYTNRDELDKVLLPKVRAELEKNKEKLAKGEEISEEDKAKIIDYAKYVIETDKDEKNRRAALAVLIASSEEEEYDSIKELIDGAEKKGQLTQDEAGAFMAYLDGMYTKKVDGSFVYSEAQRAAFRETILGSTQSREALGLGLVQAKLYGSTLKDVLGSEESMKKLGYTKVQEFDINGQKYIELKTATGTHIVPLDGTVGDVSKNKYIIPTGKMKDEKGTTYKIASKEDYVNAMKEGMVEHTDAGYEKIAVSGENIIHLKDGKRETIGYKIESAPGAYSYFNNKHTFAKDELKGTDLSGKTVYFNNKGEVLYDKEIVRAYRAIDYNVAAEAGAPSPTKGIARQYPYADIGLDLYRHTQKDAQGKTVETYYYADEKTGQMKELEAEDIEAQLATRSYQRVKGTGDVSKMISNIEAHKRWQRAVSTIFVGPTGVSKSFTDKISSEPWWKNNVDDLLEKEFFTPEKWERYICEMIVDEDMPEDAVIGYREDGEEDIMFRLQGEKEYFPDGNILYQFNWLVRAIDEKIGYTVCANYCDSSCLIIKNYKDITVEEDQSSSDYVAMYSTRNVGVISICFVTEEESELKSFSMPITYEDYVPDEDRNTYGHGTGGPVGTGATSTPSGAGQFS